MALNLPQAVAEDLQLLQHHYDQLPSMTSTHFLDPMDTFDLFASDPSPADLVAAAPVAAAEQQLMTSAFATAPGGNKRKRRKLHSSHTTRATTTQQDGLMVGSGAHVAPQLHAAAPPDTVTPPPKAPRRRRGQKQPAASAAEVDSPTSAQQAAAAVPPQLITTSTTTITAITPVVAAAAVVAPDGVRHTAAAPRRCKSAAAAAAAAAVESPSLPAGDASTAPTSVTAPLLTAGDVSTPAPSAKKTRTRKRRVTVVEEVVEEMAEADQQQQQQRSTAAPSAPNAGSTMPDAGDIPPAATPKASRAPRKSSSAGSKGRSRRKSTTASAAADGAPDNLLGTATELEAAAPAKPVRRTKKVIAAEVLEAASQGRFSELTDLSNAYSHVALFNSSSNTAAWQQLLQQAQLQPAAGQAAAAAGSSRGEQDEAFMDPGAGGRGGIGSNGRSSSLSLCRSSGLGSFRQQVWIHSQSQSVFDAELAATQDAQLAAAFTADADAGNGSAGGDDSSEQQQAQLVPALPLTPEQQQQQLKVLPNLGYACLCMTMRKYDIFNSRDVVKKTRDAPDGLQRVSELALQNARDLVPLIYWNEAHGIRLFRLSSNIFPWMTSYTFEELPDWPEIQKALHAAGDLAKQLGHRLTFHPSEYCKIAGEREAWVQQSVAELEVHSRIFDEMGFLPATPYNKINIHVGGTYGDKDAALARFSQAVNEQLSSNCKARLTVENDDRASLYSVVDLMQVHKATGIPIVFDFHHWKFCTGDQTQQEAFLTALTTWPAGVRPVVHWSESPEDPNKMLKAHSEYIDGPINLYGLEGDVDVMIESKGKELALLEYRQHIIDGGAVGPRTVRAAKFAAEAPKASKGRKRQAKKKGSSTTEEEEEPDSEDGSASSSADDE